MLLPISSQSTLSILNPTFLNSAEQSFQIMADFSALEEDTKITNAVSGC